MYWITQENKRIPSKTVEVKDLGDLGIEILKDRSCDNCLKIHKLIVSSRGLV